MQTIGLLATCYIFSCAAECDVSQEVPPLHLLQRKLDLNRTQKIQKRPNLLFIVLDQWRWDWDGHDGSLPSLPTINALGNSGVRFTRAYSPSPLCVPSRSAIAAVREYKDMWVKNNTMNYVQRPYATPTFMSRLRDAGYTTMMAGKDHLSDGHDDLADQSVDMDFLGFDWYIRAMDKYAFCDEFNTSRPKDAYGAYLKELNLLELQCLQYGYFSNGSSCSETQVCDSTTVKECGFRCPVPNPVDRKHSVDTWVRKSAEELIRNHRQRYGLGKPWFLQVNFLGPHPPLVADDVLQPEALPKAIDTNFDEVLVFDHSGRGYWVPNLKKHDVNVTEIRLLYAQHLIRIDKEIKILLETLDLNDLRQNTLIVVTADHGEHLGDHGHFAKSSPFEPSIHVPLIVNGLQIQPNTVDHPVSLIDIPMTFMDLAEATPSETMQGFSFLPALLGNPWTTRPAVMFGLNFLEEFKFENSFYPLSLGQKYFDGAAAVFTGKGFLKLICCPVGCRKQGNLLPNLFNEPQVALMNVTSERNTASETNILKGSKHGAEALYLTNFLGEEFQKACLPLLHAL